MFVNTIKLKMPAIDELQNLLDGGDRAGFYAAYSAMVGHAGNRGENGSGEALLNRANLNNA